MCTHYPLLPLLFSQSDELFVLPGNKVNGCVLQQGSKHEQETHCHPNIDGLHVGHLETDSKWIRCSLIAACHSSFSLHSDPHLGLPRFGVTLWNTGSWHTYVGSHLYCEMCCFSLIYIYVDQIHTNIRKTSLPFCCQIRRLKKCPDLTTLLPGMLFVLAFMVPMNNFSFPQSRWLS